MSPSIRFDGKTLHLPYTKKGEQKAAALKKKGATVTAKKGKK